MREYSTPKVRDGFVELVPGDELVHTYRARYGPYFILGRLLDWFNVEEGGALADLTQSGLSLPNELLIGCVLMPEPAACYEAKAPYTQVHVLPSEHRAQRFHF